MKRFALPLLGLVLIPATGFAVPAFNSEQAQKVVRKDVCHKRPSPIVDTSRSNFRSGGIGPKVISPASGVVNIAVIVVQFPTSGSYTSSTHTIQNLSAIDTRFSQMRTYFQEVSYNALNLNFRFFGSNTGSSAGDATAVQSGAVTLLQSMAYYGCGDVGDSCAVTPSPVSNFGWGGLVLIRDSLIRMGAAAPNAAGFDGVFILHAGNGNETSVVGSGATNGDIWSVFYDSRTISTSVGSSGVAYPLPGGFVDGAVFPETETGGITSALGVMCHEFGHMLGLPDLYNTNPFVCQGGCSVVGEWELMDGGPYTGSGANPAHMGAWAKLQLGWTSPSVMSSSGSVVLPYSNLITNPTAFVRFNVTNGIPGEYFLVEHRSRTSGATFDRNIPGDGLIVWHIDQQQANANGIFGGISNSVNDIYTHGHYGVGIVTADGSTITGSERGKASQAFGPTSNAFASPLSDNFDGDPTDIGIYNILYQGASLRFDVLYIAQAATRRILKKTVYPNPAGKGYPHPLSPTGDYTTVQFQSNQSAKEREIRIYTLNGDLVKKVDRTQIQLAPARSMDEKFVYEYAWDLRNDSGDKVAPGVYLYLIRIDGDAQKGKLVVIR